MEEIPQQITNTTPPIHGTHISSTTYLFFSFSFLSSPLGSSSSRITPEAAKARRCVDLNFCRLQWSSCPIRDIHLPLVHEVHLLPLGTVAAMAVVARGERRTGLAKGGGHGRARPEAVACGPSRGRRQPLTRRAARGLPGRPWPQRAAHGPGQTVAAMAPVSRCEQPAGLAGGGGDGHGRGEQCAGVLGSGGGHRSGGQREERDSWRWALAIGGDATLPLFEGRRYVFWWPPKIGRVIGGLLEKKKWHISPNMTVLWG